MALHIGEEAPNFTAETTEGTINFHDWIGDGWAILFSHPKDFTPVCTTELGYMAGLQPEFAKRNCKIIGLSIDPVTDHTEWVRDIEETQGHAVAYPLIGDTDLAVAKLYDMIHPAASGTAKGRRATDSATVRSAFVIGPDKKIKLMVTSPMSTGRNFDEVLRVRDSCQLIADTKSPRRSTDDRARTSSSSPRCPPTRPSITIPAAGKPQRLPSYRAASQIGLRQGLGTLPGPHPGPRHSLGTSL